MLFPLCTSHPGLQNPAGGTVVSQNLFWVHCESVAHPHQPEATWHTGVFSGLHALLLVPEHWVHCPASAPDV